MNQEGKNYCNKRMQIVKLNNPSAGWSLAIGEGGRECSRRKCALSKMSLNCLAIINPTDKRDVASTVQFRLD